MIAASGIDNAIALGVALILVAYLVWVIISPERF